MYTFACVTMWFLLNMTIANLNKWIFSKHKFSYAALLTLLHMIACFVLSAVTLQLRAAPPKPLSPNGRRAVFQLSLVFVVSVAAGNAALEFIHVSFSQAIGATAPLWTVLLSVVITRRSYPPLVYVALGLISLGMMLTVRGEVNFHPIGFALVVTATLTRALKSIMQGVLLASADEKLDSTVLLYHMSWRSALWLGAWCVAMERGALSDEKLASGTLWAFILASSLVSFFLNVSQFLVTQATSAVTMQVLGNIKVVALILVSVAIYGNEVSLMAGCGCALCISGVVLYNVATRKPPPRLDARSV